MTTEQKKRIAEAGTISVDASGTKFRVCLIREGKGSSASFPREFFVQENADALAGSLSFPGHPENIYRPENRNPLSAIGHIAEAAVIEIDPETNLAGIWSEYNVAKSKATEVGPYLAEYAHKLGLSIYIDTDGYVDEVTGTFVATRLDATDPYKSVDLVVAAGAGGKFDRAVEALRRITEASATAAELKKENSMDPKDVEKAVADGMAPVLKAVEGLVQVMTGKAVEAEQIKADDAAVEKIVESRFGEYDKANDLIIEAKLTESQTAEARALARAGHDVAPYIAHAQKILAEARANDENEDGDEPTYRKTAEAQLGDRKPQSPVTTGFAVPGFGVI